LQILLVTFPESVTVNPSRIKGFLVVLIGRCTEVVQVGGTLSLAKWFSALVFTQNQNWPALAFYFLLSNKNCEKKHPW